MFKKRQARSVIEKKRMVDASKERLARERANETGAPFTIQIGRRIVLREARRMRDPVRRRTGHGSRPTFDKYPLAIFWKLPIADYSFIRKLCHFASSRSCVTKPIKKSEITLNKYFNFKTL